MSENQVGEPRLHFPQIPNWLLKPVKIVTVVAATVAALGGLVMAEVALSPTVFGQSSLWGIGCGFVAAFCIFAGTDRGHEFAALRRTTLGCVGVTLGIGLTFLAADLLSFGSFANVAAGGAGFFAGASLMLAAASAGMAALDRHLPSL